MELITNARYRVSHRFFLSVIKTKTKVLCLSSRAVTHRVDSYILRPRCTNYVRICRAPHLRVNFYWRGRHSADIIESAVCVAFCSRMLLVVCSPLPRACPLYESVDSVLSLLAVVIWRLVCICCVIRCNCNQAGWINRCYVWILSTRPVPVCDCIRHLDVQTQTIYTFIHNWSPSMCMCTMYVCTSLSGLCGPVHVKHPLCSRLHRCMWCDVHVYWIQFTANVMSTSRIWFFFSFFFFIFFSFCCARSYAKCWDCQSNICS